MGASLHVHSEPLIPIKLIHVWLDILTIKIKIKNKKNQTYLTEVLTVIPSTSNSRQMTSIY